MIRAVLLAAVNGGNRKTWHILLPIFQFGSNIGALDALDLSDLTMRSALAAVFGEYQPKTQTVSTYYDGQLLESSTEYVPGVAGMDMEWIAGVITFIVLFYCLMKLLGGVFK